MKKITRQGLTDAMLKKFAVLDDDGLSILDIMMGIAKDTEECSDTRLRACIKLSDIAYTKEQSIAVDISEENDTSQLQRLAKLKMLQEKHQSKLITLDVAGEITDVEEEEITEEG